MALGTGVFIGLASYGFVERRLMRLPGGGGETNESWIHTGLVTPAKAGVQEVTPGCYWRCIPCGQIPGFALPSVVFTGMTCAD
jgi:hypothetical protein